MKRQRQRHRAGAARLAASIALTAAAVAACGSIGGSTGSAGNALGAPSGQPITVGFTVSLTGPFSADGAAELKGYQLWASDVNAHGGLLGRPVKLVYYNDNSDPPTTTKEYTKLVTTDHVSLLVGPFSTLLNKQAGPVAHKYGYAYVEGSGGAPGVFNLNLPNLFGTSAPVADQMDPLVNWIDKLPIASRPRSAAYVMVDDPFADPPVEHAHQLLSAHGIATTYFNDNPGVPPLTPLSPGATGKLLEPNLKTGVFAPNVLASAADAVANKHPDIVFIGSVDVPTLSGIINEFRRIHFNPKLLVATSGPDQGQAFLNAIGAPGNATGIMVPNGWYGQFPDALSHLMVQEYIAKYGGTSADVNADVAEAYSAGQLMADAVTAVGLNQQKIINYLHSPNLTWDTVQGPEHFGLCQPAKGNGCGMNTVAVSFMFQWQSGHSFAEVLTKTGALPGFIPSKPNWAS